MKLLTALFLAAATAASAHELLVNVEVSATTVVARVSYGSHDPAAGCDVIIYRPDSSDNAFQEGRTDANGVFSFVPDRKGEWRLIADDGMGHRVEQVVKTDAEVVAESDASWPFDWQKALTGVSLIFGAAGVLLWLKTRSGSEVASGR